jgi:hypothetical protein
MCCASGPNIWPSQNWSTAVRLGEPMAASAQRLSARPRWGEWQAHPELTGGAVLDLHIHDVDACNWLFGEPRSVYARGQQSHDGGWDHSFTTIDYGAVAANVEGGWMLPDGHPFTYGMRVICERGSITFDPKQEGLHRLLVYEPGQGALPAAIQCRGSLSQPGRLFRRLHSSWPPSATRQRPAGAPGSRSLPGSAPIPRYRCCYSNHIKLFTTVARDASSWLLSAWDDLQKTATSTGSHRYPGWYFQRSSMAVVRRPARNVPQFRSGKTQPPHFHCSSL